MDLVGRNRLSVTKAKVQYCVIHCKLCESHRYTWEIPEPVPFWSLDGAQIWGILVSLIKITVVIRGVCHCIYCSLSVKIYKCWNAAWCAKIVDDFVLDFVLSVSKNLNTEIWVPWLTTPLHRVVWDLSLVFCGERSPWNLPPQGVNFIALWE